ncbi:ATP-binding protein [Haliscomenobacter sp.]|uniref:ATP-binding protein n=1 Tax=Haliscomenobacter sp. TaxID=2717303 RepID=UPI0029F5446E|nr:ATP-binding protein [Haliscomenobacter sp.]
MLNKGWKWHAGDNPDWRKPSFDDRQWKKIDPTSFVPNLKKLQTKQPLWLRIKLETSLKTAALSIKQSGATEIFLNGKRIKSYGKIDPTGKNTLAFTPIGEYLLLNLDSSTSNTLAIRYYFQQGIRYKAAFDANYPLFSSKLYSIDSLSTNLDYPKYFWEGFNIAIGVIFFLTHFILFLFYPPTRANLWYSLWGLLGALSGYCLLAEKTHGELYLKNQFTLLNLLIGPIGNFLVFYTVYLLLKQSRKFFLWIFITLSVLATVQYFLSEHGGESLFSLLATLSYVLLVIYMGYDAYKQANRGGLYVMIGMFVYLVSWLVFVLYFAGKFHNEAIGHIIFHVATLSLPVTVSTLLGLDFGNTNRVMIKNLQDINRLSEEKQQILSSQNETLENQVAERTAELSSKNRELEIEAALERVRSRTMAMQHSNELADASLLLFEQMKKLGLNYWTSGFCIWRKDGSNLVENWMNFGAEGGALPPLLLPYLEDEGHRGIYEASLRGEFLYAQKFEGEALEKHYNLMMATSSARLVFQKAKEAGFIPPPVQWKYAAIFKQGYLLFVAIEPLPNISNIAQRFAKVFEQTYTRFLDLQKAEAQAELARLNLIQIQTENKRAEDALIALKQTQAQLIQSEKLASLGELTAGIAHEIQNPLNFVNNFAEVSAEMLDEMHEELEKGDTTEAIAIATDLKTNLEKINHHGQRASAIVKGMLEHSRQSRDVACNVSTDINALADEYLRLAYHGWRAKDNGFNCKIETHFDPYLPLVSVIPQDIGRVLLNLINNAFYAVQQRTVETLHATSLQHPPYQPTVTISTKRLDNAIEIRVQDNGNGIPESIREKIFQPFFTTKPTGQGTGLGLSLAYDIVTKGHGGSLMVESVEGEGSTFIIYLSLKITQS